MTNLANVFESSGRGGIVMDWREKMIELCLENSFLSLGSSDQEVAMELYRICRRALG